MSGYKVRADPILWIQPILVNFKLPHKKYTMSKGTHFFGQRVYGQLIKSLDRAKIVEMSCKNGGEKYVRALTAMFTC